MTLAKPNMAPKSPCQRPRSRGLKRSPTKANALTIMAPPPMPCMPRKIMSCSIEVAAPASIRADKKDDNADDKKRLAAVEVGEFAVQRHVTVEASM
jgi:hypothetical protein